MDLLEYCHFLKHIILHSSFWTNTTSINFYILLYKRILCKRFLLKYIGKKMQKSNNLCQKKEAKYSIFLPLLTV